MGRIIEFGMDARSKILAGMEEAADAVTSTLGPKGKTVILDNGTIHPVMTKDGISVLKFIDFTDKYKNLGVNIIREATRKVNGECGDGSTTTTLLTTELCKAGCDLINHDFDAVDVKKGFQKATNDVIDMLNKQKKYVETEDDILHIATISANNDEEIGGIIKDAFINVGDNGIVCANVAKNRQGKTEITYSNGLEIPRGYISSVCANSDNDTCILNNPTYFVYGKLLNDLKDVMPIFQIAKGDLVIVAPAYSDKFITDFIQNVELGKIHGVAIGPAGASKEIMEDNLQDIAIMVNATIVEGKNGVSIDTFDKKYLGSSESIMATASKTNIIGGQVNESKLEEHLNKIRNKIAKGMNGTDEESLSEYEIRYLNSRIASLTGGIATIWIGGFTDLEIKEKKDRYEDAINAVNTAIEFGTLAGGGAGLLHAINEVSKNHKRLDNDTQEKGYQAYLKVLEAPARKIIKTTSKEPGLIIEKIKESTNVNSGYNAKIEQFSEDMYSDGIIDPAKVEVTALQYANSIAGTFITSDCVITSDNYNCHVVANDRVLDEEEGGQWLQN